MKARRSSRPKWLLCTLLLAVIAALLRRWQIETSFEGELNLAIPMAPASMALGCTLVIAAAVFGLLAAGQQVVEAPRKEQRQGRWDRAMAAPGDPIGLTVLVLAAFLMLAAVPFLFREGLSMWQMFRSGAEGVSNNGLLMLATAVTAFLAFVGLLVAGRSAYRGSSGRGGAFLCAVNGCLWLMELYRGHAADPVLWDYVPMLLAIVAGMLMYMDWGGLSCGQPRPRRTLWLAGMTAVLSAVALAGEWQLGEVLMLCAQTVAAFVVLARLPVNLEHPSWASRVSVPEPERQWRGADGADLDGEKPEEERPEEDARTPGQEIQEEESHE